MKQKKNRGFKRKVLAELKFINQRNYELQTENLIREMEMIRMFRSLQEHEEFLRNPKIKYWFEEDCNPENVVLRCRLLSPKGLIDLNSRTYVMQKYFENDKEFIFKKVFNDFKEKFFEKVRFEEVETTKRIVIKTED